MGVLKTFITQAGIKSQVCVLALYFIPPSSFIINFTIFNAARFVDYTDTDECQCGTSLNRNSHFYTQCILQLVIM